MGDVRKRHTPEGTQRLDLVLTERFSHRFMSFDSYCVAAVCPKQHLKTHTLLALYESTS